VGRVRTVGVAIHYRLDGPGIESRCGWDFRHGPGAHPASCAVGTGSFSRGLIGRGVALTTHPYPERRLKSGVCYYSPSGTSWQVIKDVLLIGRNDDMMILEVFTEVTVGSETVVRTVLAQLPDFTPQPIRESWIISADVVYLCVVKD
jgi:hypothetical protein